MHDIPDDVYTQIEHSTPIFVPVRRVEGGTEIGLILRESPFGRRHLGGRMERGESVGEAIRRHAGDTLGVQIDLGRPATGMGPSVVPRSARTTVRPTA